MNDEPVTWEWTDAQRDKGLALTVGGEGVKITGWYDGGYEIDLDATVTWAELAALRPPVNPE